MMICIKLLVMLLKIPSNEIILAEISKPFFNFHLTKNTRSIQSLKIREILFITPKPCRFFLCKDNSEFSFPTKSLKFKRFPQPKVVFNMGKRKSRRTRRTESQSPDRDENMSETSLLQGNATLTNVSENVNNVFDRNIGSELTETSQISNEIVIITQRLSEQNNNKMTQIEHQLNSKFEEIL